MNSNTPEDPPAERSSYSESASYGEGHRQAQASPGFSLAISQALQWGDMDAYQHINNTRYFQFFEDMRIVYFQAVGINAYMAEHNIGPILGSTECRFLAPLTYPDTITISTRVGPVREKRFTMFYEISSLKQQQPVATGSGEIIFVDYNRNKTIEIPVAIRDAIVTLESPLSS